MRATTTACLEPSHRGPRCVVQEAMLRLRARTLVLLVNELGKRKPVRTPLAVDVTGGWVRNESPKLIVDVALMTPTAAGVKATSTSLLDDHAAAVSAISRIEVMVRSPGGHRANGGQGPAFL